MAEGNSHQEKVFCFVRGQMCDTGLECTRTGCKRKFQHADEGAQLVDLRMEVSIFASAMELKLRKNDHKTGWRELPIEALFRQLMLELEEFKVADEFLSVAEARKELVDVANFCLMLHDRLGMIRQDANRHAAPDIDTKDLVKI